MQKSFLTAVILTVISFVPAQAQIDSAISLTIHENKIHNAADLEPFFEKLYALKTYAAKSVSIIHLGDSHIQADLLTEVVRKNLQREFGNAGRGLIVPGKVAGTNEPLNFKSYSASAWNSKRIVHPYKPLPIGIGGITINTLDEGARFGVKMSDPTMDYRFNTVNIFFNNDANCFQLSVQDSIAFEFAQVGGNVHPEARYFSRVTLPARVNHVVFQTVRASVQQNHATVFGISFENGNTGLLYHAIGVNGAKYEHYNSAELFARQTPLLNPDLFIISLGTNESVEYPNINKNFLSQVSKLINSLASSNPEAKFILVTPPDSFLRKVKPNPGVETVRSQIIQYAVENGIAFWDMYKINGGSNSALEWKMRGLLRPDGIHFSKEGYAYQGQLLFEAIMKSYADYVSVRYP